MKTKIKVKYEILSNILWYSKFKFEKLQQFNLFETHKNRQARKAINIFKLEYAAL